MTIDFKVFANVMEIQEALKEERLKTKYSAEYHAEVLAKMYSEMPCEEVHEIRAKIDITILLVGTIF